MRQHTANGDDMLIGRFETGSDFVEKVAFGTSGSLFSVNFGRMKL